MIDLSNTIFKTYDDVEVKDMNSYEDILEFVEEENVKFIRLAFFDVFGVQKNIAIMPDELKRALKEFKGSVLLVSHEPEFYEDWVDKVWNIEDWTTKII